MPLTGLSPGMSPRFVTEDEAHIRRLAETDDELPPIVVHRQSMRIIDGLHRYRAALLRNEDTIRVEFFDGSEDDAYIHAVQANVRHGLPLTLAERKAAAERVIGMRPELSDRAVASMTGLSAKTAGAVRRRMGAAAGTARTRRVGLDGRTRPTDVEEGRRKALRVIQESPDASVREIARVAGVSVGTAHSLRSRVQDRKVTSVRLPAPAAEPAPAPACAPGRGPAGAPGQQDPAARLFARLESLQRDPSLRFTERGRAVLLWLRRRLMTCAEGERELSNVPVHLLPVIAALALECAAEWTRLADELDHRTRQAAPRQSRR